MKKLLTLIFLFSSLLISAQDVINIGGGGFPFGNKKGFIYGTLYESGTKEPIIGAIIRDVTSDNAIVTDVLGEFRLRVPLGKTIIDVQSLGFIKTRFILQVGGEGKYSLSIDADTKQLEEVVVSGAKLDDNIKSTDIGKNSLSIESIKQLPMSMGEIDVIKSLTLLPGVSSNSELSTGFNVRGGGSDQNLVLLGDVPIYNPAHLFGFYTSFNAEVVDDVTLYKGGIPANYGGRASSVLHVKYRDGDYQKWKAGLSVGIVSSKISLEGPIVKDKLSVLGSFRKSYVNWMLRSFDDPDVQSSSTDFYDVNAIVNWRLNDKNKFTYSIYRSEDNFNLAGDTLYNWINYYNSLSWYHSFSENLNLKVVGALSQYDNTIENVGKVDAYKLNSRIENQILNADLEYILSKNMTAHVGFNLNNTKLNPGELIPDDNEDNQVNYRKVQDEFASEYAVYGDFSWEVNDKLTLNAGGRFNWYDYYGEHTVYSYAENRPQTVLNITDSASFSDGESIQTYSGFEPRLSLRYGLNATSSIKIGYNRMYQYIQLISNTTTIAPNDIWKLSDDKIKPQISEQLSAGYFKNFSNNKFETSIEGFYKETDNVVDYKDGADLFLNDQLETALIDGIGRSYGIEVYARKKSGGRLTGWISYTYSRSERKVQGLYEDETINGGDWYLSNFDRTHNFTNVLIYKLPKKWEFSANFSFKTGQPVTYPAGKIPLGDEVIPLYIDRNTERAPANHRLDISFTKKFNFLKTGSGEFNFSVYNLYGRKNAFSVFFQDVDGSPPQPYQLAVLGVPFPSISFTFKI